MTPAPQHQEGEWERGFRDKWEGGNAGHNGLAISSEAMKAMLDDIRSLLAREYQRGKEDGMTEEAIGCHDHSLADRKALLERIRERVKGRHDEDIYYVTAAEVRAVLDEEEGSQSVSTEYARGRKDATDLIESEFRKGIHDLDWEKLFIAARKGEDANL